MNKLNYIITTLLCVTLLVGVTIYGLNNRLVMSSSGNVSITNTVVMAAPEDEYTNTSVRRFLGFTPDGRARYSIDSHIGWRYYQDKTTGQWLEIQPKLMPDIDGGYYSTGTPYYLYVNPQGDRWIYPDRHDKSKYIYVPASPVFSTLVKSYSESGLTAITPALDVSMKPGTTGDHLFITFKSQPAFSSIAFTGVQAVGLDINELLQAKEGIGIPAPRLIDAEGVEKALAWVFKDGRLSVALDFSGLKFPVQYLNSPLDVSVGASADDDLVYRSLSYWFNTATEVRAGYQNSSLYMMGSAMRFTGVNIPSGAVVTPGVCKITLVAALSTSNNVVNSDICCENSNNPGQISDYANHIGRVRTSGVAWDSIAAWTAGVSYQSPDFSSEVQTVVDDNGGTGSALIVFWEDKDDESTHTNVTYRSGASWDHASYAPPAVHIEYSTGGCSENISNTPESKAFGVVATSSTYWSNGSEPSWPLGNGDCYFYVTNNSGGAVDITVEATNFTGGVGWTLGAPGENTARLTVFKSGDGSGDGVTITTSPQSFISALADSTDKYWELKFETPTSNTDGEPKSSTITLSASCT